jgi:hypothetical protein
VNVASEPTVRLDGRLAVSYVRAGVFVAPGHVLPARRLAN